MLQRRFIVHRKKIVIEPRLPDLHASCRHFTPRFVIGDGEVNMSGEPLTSTLDDATAHAIQRLNFFRSDLRKFETGEFTI
jgi:hypothetical protein